MLAADVRRRRRPTTGRENACVPARGDPRARLTSDQKMARAERVHAHVRYTWRDAGAAAPRRAGRCRRGSQRRRPRHWPGTRSPCLTPGSTGRSVDLRGGGEEQEPGARGAAHNPAMRVRRVRLERERSAQCGRPPWRRAVPERGADSSHDQAVTRDPSVCHVLDGGHRIESRSLRWPRHETPTPTARSCSISDLVTSEMSQVRVYAPINTYARGGAYVL